MKKVYQLLASAVQARLNCIANDNTEWKEKHEDTIAELLRRLPHGSGFDRGTKLDLEKSTGEKLVFLTAFHHMDDNGYYCGWTEHTVTVTASLVFGFSVNISGRNHRAIKDYIAESFQCCLSDDVEAAEVVS